MRLNKPRIGLLILTPILFLTACGTFEIGIENNVNLETQVPTQLETPLETQVATQAAPTSENVDIVSPVETPTPVPSDEQQIAAALAEKFGQSADQLGITVNTISGDHATGGISNGYFLAAREEGSWVIVYDGQATPPCVDIEQYRFPVEMVPECLDAGSQLVVRGDGGGDAYSQAIDNLQSLECDPGSPGATPGTVEAIACNIQDGLRSRNISALLGYMSDPFIIGYWLSEGVQYTPTEFLDFLPQLYNFNDPDYTPRLTFTTDRSQFPDLQGRPVESVLGPDVNVVEVIYSQGWGADGESSALIYLIQDPAGDYKWHSMLIGIFSQ